MAGDKEFGIDCIISEVLQDYTYRWFDYWLKDEGRSTNSWPNVQYYMMGENKWREGENWPPDCEYTPLYLSSGGQANSKDGDGRLKSTKPTESEDIDSFEYDPRDPVPTKGGHILMSDIQSAGVQDQSIVESRDDVLVYTSAHLTSPLQIAGPVKVTLFVSSSAPDTDFTAKLVDVEPDGYCANITEGIIRARYNMEHYEEEYLCPNNVYKFEFELWDTAFTFQKNHRIRLEVSSSNFPRFDRNPNSKVPPSKASKSDFDIATQQIYHSKQRPSRVELPIINE
jgi:putative CocE/NonD family hydrolase